MNHVSSTRSGTALKSVCVSVASCLFVTAAACAGNEDVALSSAQEVPERALSEGAPTTLQQVAQVDGWNPEDCDEVYRIASYDPADKSKPFPVQPGRETHTNILQDPPWGDQPVQAIGFKPFTDNKKVLHHWILNARGAFLAGWAPGDDERPPLPSDVGIDLPLEKASLGLNLHYYNTAGTQVEFDRSGVDVCVLKTGRLRPKLAAVAGLAAIGSGGVLAPAGAVKRPISATCTLAGTEPVHLITAGPHAHTYAVHMRFTAKRQNGEEIVLHDQPFRFGEQGTYPLPGGEVVLNPGDTITTECSYTNPTTRDIRFGESTDQEMCFNFASYYPKGSLRCAGGRFGGAVPPGALPPGVTLPPGFTPPLGDAIPQGGVSAQ